MAEAKPETIKSGRSKWMCQMDVYMLLELILIVTLGVESEIVTSEG